MYLYSRQDIERADEQAIHRGLSAFTLMENAGRGLFYQVKELISKRDQILVLSGRGNNGGDGIVLTRYLRQAGYAVDLVFPAGLVQSEEALKHLHYFREVGFQEAPFQPSKRYDVIIDSLLGIRTRLPLSESIKTVISWANSQTALRIAIDLPTGVTANTGEADEGVFQADYTFALHGYKPSRFLFPSERFYGQTAVIDIGLPQWSKWRIWTKEDVQATWPPNPSNAHKGSFGHGLLIAGSDQMPGSAALAAIGALRCGIGKLTIQTSQYAAAIIACHAPEATYEFSKELEPLDRFDGLAIGCGLPPDDQLERTILQCLQHEGVLILDAGALSPRSYRLQERKANVLLTPHPGEFARITGGSVQTIQKRRIELASEYAREQRVTVLLKGQYSVIAFPDGTGIINMSGNEALAKGGTGDMLTGMLLAGIMRTSDFKAAVGNAVFLHGACADEWTADRGASALSAHDMNALIPVVMKKITGK